MNFKTAIMKNHYARAWNQVCLEEEISPDLMRRQSKEMADVVELELKQMEITSSQASKI